MNKNIIFTKAEINTLGGILLNNIAELEPNIPDGDLQFYIDLHNKITGDDLTVQNVRESIFPQAGKTTSLKEAEIDQYGSYVDPY
jgi:hypothetical protein